MKDFWTSISALENAYGKDGKTGGCVRRWWFDKICKLPQPARAATIFGDVFHAVLARYYLADDRGLDETNKPVNIYPPGWKSVKSKFAKTEEVIGEISELDETLIRTLVDKAIADGYLIREPGRLVERDVSQTLYTDQITGQKIVWRGFIDLETNSSVEDHKTSKSTRYIVSVKKLKINVQMVMYGWDKYERGHLGNLWLRHNNYIKDYGDPQIIQRSAEVIKDYVYDYYNTILLPRFKDMLKYSQTHPANAVEKWRDLPPPNNSERECNYYYGHSCPFIGICTGQCDVALYRAKYEPVRKEVSDMGLIDTIKKRNAEIMAAAGAGSVAQPATQPAHLTNAGQGTQVSHEEPVSAEVRPTAPWHHPGCVACQDNPYGGFNSKGSACTVCDAQSEQNGRLTSTCYGWDYDDDNNLVFTQIPGSVPTYPEKPVEEKPVEEKPVEKKTKTVKTRKPRTKKQKAPPEPTPDPALDLTLTVTETIPETTQAVPAIGGFKLLIGCTFFNSSTALMSTDEILVGIFSGINQAAGKPIAEIEHFALLQGIDAVIPDIAKELASDGAWVVSFQPTKGTALARLVDGLRQYADVVIVNIGS